MDNNHNPFLNDKDDNEEEYRGLFYGIFGTEEEYEEFKKEYLEKQKELQEFINERKN